MKETIFFLEGRGGLYLYQFFIYNLGGLNNILNNKYSVRGPTNTSVLFDDLQKLTPYPTIPISFPIKIHMKHVIPFQREAFEIIKDLFILIEDLSTIPEYEIISIYGETCIHSPYGDNNKIMFPFVRNLFLDKIPHNTNNKRRILITRKGSENQHGGVLKRCILNEDEIIQQLNHFRIERIQLESYSMKDKIQLFRESELIISSHSGSLTLLLFVNTQTTIIELLNKNMDGIPKNHYLNMSNILGIKYNKYSDFNEDSNGNFELNSEKFSKYLSTII